MSSRRQQFLDRVNWYLQSTLKHITKLITGNKSCYKGGRYRQVSLYYHCTSHQSIPTPTARILVNPWNIRVSDLPMSCSDFPHRRVTRIWMLVLDVRVTCPSRTYLVLNRLCFSLLKTNFLFSLCVVSSRINHQQNICSWYNQRMCMPITYVLFQHTIRALFHYKDRLSRYDNSHHEHKTAVRPSYFHNNNSCADKTTSLYRRK